jgi:hypothetical protein
MLTSPPTPIEALGAALLRAGYQQASYRPPQMTLAGADLGGCSAGWWIAPSALGGFYFLYYRPEGVLGPDTDAVQRVQLEAYATALHGAGYEAIPDRRMKRRAQSVPCLLVRKAEAPDG